MPPKKNKSRRNSSASNSISYETQIKLKSRAEFISSKKRQDITEMPLRKNKIRTGEPNDSTDHFIAAARGRELRHLVLRRRRRRRHHVPPLPPSAAALLRDRRFPGRRRISSGSGRHRLRKPQIVAEMALPGLNLEEIAGIQGPDLGKAVGRWDAEERGRIHFR